MLSDVYTRGHRPLSVLHSAQSGLFLKSECIFFLDTWLLQIHVLIMKIDNSWGDLTDISAEKTSLLLGSQW